MTPGQQVQLAITTMSQDQASPSQSGTPPKITMNGNAFPQPQGPYAGTGLQLAVLDPTMDITSPAAIRTNTYLYVANESGSWMESYEWMWAGVVKQILTSGDLDQQLIILATFGLDANMAPSSDALALLQQVGAGPQIQKWETSVDVGSQSGQWVAFPGNYILVGNSAYGWGEGTEVYELAGQQSSVTSTAQVTLTNAA